MPIRNLRRVTHTGAAAEKQTWRLQATHTTPKVSPALGESDVQTACLARGCMAQGFEQSIISHRCGTCRMACSTLSGFRTTAMLSLISQNI